MAARVERQDTRMAERLAASPEEISGLAQALADFRASAEFDLLENILTFGMSKKEQADMLQTRRMELALGELGTLPRVMPPVRWAKNHVPPPRLSTRTLDRRKPDAAAGNRRRRRIGKKDTGAQPPG